MKTNNDTITAERAEKERARDRARKKRLSPEQRAKKAAYDRQFQQRDDQKEKKREYMRAKYGPTPEQIAQRAARKADWDARIKDRMDTAEREAAEARLLHKAVRDGTVTRKQITERIDYNPETGVFMWKAGWEAGTKTRNGYIHINMTGKIFMAHRLAWFMTHGYWPAADIDHINGVRHDNRIANLREATRSQNALNSGKYKTNRSGFKGVHWCAKDSRWLATSMVNGKTERLGSFDTAEKAAEAYRMRAIERHGEFIHRSVIKESV